MGFVGKEPAEAALTSDDITDGIIVNADINASAAIAMSKTAFSAGTGVTLSTNTLNVDAAQTGITSLLATNIKIGEDDQTKIDFEDDNKINFYANNAKEVELAENNLSPGTSDGTALGTTSLMWSDLFLADGGVINLNNGDVLLTHSSNTLTLTGGGLVVGVDDTGHDVKFFGATSGKYMEWDESADQLDVTGSFDVTGNSSMVGTLTVGVDDTGHDVKFFGASAGAYMEWDESADQLRIMGASADATTSTGKLLLATSLTDINANDVIGKIEFQAPHEAGGTDAITVSAGIEAVAQGTFSASVNSTDLVFKTGHSEAATEKFRFTSQGEIGIGGTNYGTSGQLLTSGGAGAAPSWADAAAGGSSVDLVADGSISAGDRVAITSGGKAKTIAALQANTGNTQLNMINDTGQNAYMAMDADPDTNRFLTVYRDNSNSQRMTALVVDGDSNNAFTEGSEVVINSTSAGGPACMIYDPSVDRFAVFINYSSKIYGYVATIDNSDNSVSFGSATEVFDNTNQMSPTGVAFDPDTGRVLLSWVSTNPNPDEIRAAVITVTGSSTNTLAAGTALNISGTSGSNQGNTAAGYGFDPHIIYDTEVDRAVCVWQDANGHPTSVVLTVTGSSTNTLAAGSEVELTDTNYTWTNAWPTMIYDDTSNKIVYGIYDGNTARGEIWVGTTTGGGTNTAAWSSSPTNLVSGDSMYHLALFPVNDSSGNIIYSFRDDTKSNGTDLIQVGVGTVSGTGSSASFSSKFQTKIYTTYLGDSYIFIRKGGTGNKIAVFTEEANDLYAGVPDLPDNAPDFIGIANSAISDTATGTITTVGGVGTNQSSLSAGITYFLDGAGALTTSATDYPKIGPALTSSTILIGNINTY